MDNAGYYHAAYIVAALIYGAYAASLWWRGRDLARREADADARRAGGARAGTAHER